MLTGICRFTQETCSFRKLLAYKTTNIQKEILGLENAVVKLLNPRYLVCRANSPNLKILELDRYGFFGGLMPIPIMSSKKSFIFT